MPAHQNRCPFRVCKLPVELADQFTTKHLLTLWNTATIASPSVQVMLLPSVLCWRALKPLSVLQFSIAPRE
jgi:hypothetical protein